MTPREGRRRRSGRRRVAPTAHRHIVFAAATAFQRLRGARSGRPLVDLAARQHGTRRLGAPDRAEGGRFRGRLVDFAADRPRTNGLEVPPETGVPGCLVVSSTLSLVDLCSVSVSVELVISGRALAASTWRLGGTCSVVSAGAEASRGTIPRSARLPGVAAGSTSPSAGSTRDDVACGASGSSAATPGPRRRGGRDPGRTTRRESWLPLHRRPRRHLGAPGAEQGWRVDRPAGRLGRCVDRAS